MKRPLLHVLRMRVRTTAVPPHLARQTASLSVLPDKDGGKGFATESDDALAGGQGQYCRTVAEANLHAIAQSKHCEMVPTDDFLGTSPGLVKRDTQFAASEHEPERLVRRGGPAVTTERAAHAFMRIDVGLNESRQIRAPDQIAIRGIQAYVAGPERGVSDSIANTIATDRTLAEQLSRFALKVAHGTGQRRFEFNRFREAPDYPAVGADLVNEFVTAIRQQKTTSAGCAHVVTERRQTLRTDVPRWRLLYVETRDPVVAQVNDIQDSAIDCYAARPAVLAGTLSSSANLLDESSVRRILHDAIRPRVEHVEIPVVISLNLFDPAEDVFGVAVCNSYRELRRRRQPPLSSSRRGDQGCDRTR